MSTGREIALAAGAAAIFGGGIVAGFGWERPTALFPTVIGAAGLALALWAIVSDALTARGGKRDEVPLSDDDRARARGSFLWIGIFFVAVLLIGFEWGLGLAALAFYRLEARVGWVAAVIAGGLCGGFMYVAAQFLKIPLYDGFLVELIF